MKKISAILLTLIMFYGFINTNIFAKETNEFSSKVETINTISRPHITYDNSYFYNSSENWVNASNNGVYVSYKITNAFTKEEKFGSKLIPANQKSKLWDETGYYEIISIKNAHDGEETSIYFSNGTQLQKNFKIYVFPEYWSYESSLGINDMASWALADKAISNNLDFIDLHLMNDLNWTSKEISFPSMGSNEHVYTGIFDGRDYSINGIYIDESDSEYVGLFARLGSQGVIKNLNIDVGSIKGFRYVGGIVGKNEGTIINSSNEATVVGMEYVGGITGYNSNIILHSWNSQKVSGPWNYWDDGQWYIGGIAGFNESVGLIKATYNTGKVEGDSAIGGIVGQNDGKVTNSFNVGAIKGDNQVGGIAGHLQHQDSALINCISTGAIIGFWNVGKIAGNANYNNMNNTLSWKDSYVNRNSAGQDGNYSWVRDSFLKPGTINGFLNEMNVSYFNTTNVYWDQIPLLYKMGTSELMVRQDSTRLWLAGGCAICS